MGDLPEGVTGISIDTRTLRQGEAFFAIKGERFDGHDFLSTAQRGGAGIAVVAEHKLPALGRVQIPMLVVDDVLKALSRLAEAARARSKAKIVAVTGSVGKTSVTQAIKAGLDLAGRRRDGSTFPAEISLSAIDADAGILVTAAVRDVIERHGIDRSLRRR